MALRMPTSRADDEYRSLLRLLLAHKGACADPGLRQELVDTGYVRRDAHRADLLHLTPEGRRFLASE
jgi:hypothetical protein